MIAIQTVLTLAKIATWSLSAVGNPSVLYHCTGGRWTVDLGLRPGAEGTDLCEVMVINDKGELSAFEATLTSGRLSYVLNAGLVVLNKTDSEDQGLLRIEPRGEWIHQRDHHALQCERIGPISTR